MQAYFFSVRVILGEVEERGRKGEGVRKGKEGG